jgi:hypothetical protein
MTVSNLVTPAKHTKTLHCICFGASCKYQPSFQICVALQASNSITDRAKLELDVSRPDWLIPRRPRESHESSNAANPLSTCILAEKYPASSWTKDLTSRKCLWSYGTNQQRKRPPSQPNQPSIATTFLNLHSTLFCSFGPSKSLFSEASKSF